MSIYEEAHEAGRALSRIKYHLNPDQWQAFLDAIPFFVALVQEEEWEREHGREMDTDTPEEGQKPGGRGEI